MGQKRALVFDDDPDILQMFQMLLECRGYQVFTFEDPSDYCDLQSAHCPLALNARCADVIVSDVKMPRVDGLQFMQTIMDRGCRVPAKALMSGNWTVASLDAARSLGCHVFSKPMHVREVFDWLTACEKRQNPTSLATLEGSKQAVGYCSAIRGVRQPWVPGHASLVSCLRCPAERPVGTTGRTIQ